MTRLSKLALILAFTAFTGFAGAQEAARTPDETITANVKSMFAQHPDLKVDKVSVSTKQGTVYLSGSVDTPSEQRDLEEIAQKAAGVKKVVNQTNVVRGVN